MPESIVNTEAVQPLVTPVVTEPDLITKVTQFKKEETNPVVQDGVDIGFDYKKIEDIKDPVAKKWAEDAYKSMQSGATKKFQEAAEIKKSAEQRLLEANRWTREKLQKELQNPEFITVAQEVANLQNPPNSGLTEEQFSVLTDKEKTELVSLKNEIKSLQQVNYQTAITQQDVQLSSRYSDYDSLKVNKGFEDLSRMNPIELREHVYKAMLHDEHVKNAYEMGKKESQQLNQEKRNAFSILGLQATNSNDVPQQNKNESSEAYFLRIAQGRLAQFKK